MRNRRDVNIQFLTVMKRIYILFIAIVSLFFAIGCSSSKKNDLVGRWSVKTYTDPFKTTMEATKVSPNESYTLQFHDTGIFSLTTDCNTISGEYSTDGQSLRFSNLSATELACEKEIAERSLKSQLPMVESYNFPNDTTLCLLGKQGNILVKLVKVINWQR